MSLRAAQMIKQHSQFAFNTLTFLLICRTAIRVFARLCALFPHRVLLRRVRHACLVLKRLRARLRAILSDYFTFLVLAILAVADAQALRTTDHRRRLLFRCMGVTIYVAILNFFVCLLARGALLCN